MYFDNAATTPLSPDVKEYITSLLDDFGNPSSTYAIGLKNRNLIENTRKIVKEFINAEFDEEIIFASSGSAANTLGIVGWNNGYSMHLYSPTAHKSMLQANMFMDGIKLKVNHEGFLELVYLKDILDACKQKNYKCLVSVEYANSELGTINKVEEIIEIVHSYNGLVLLDCTGSIPYIPIDVQKLDVDMITFSGHKLGALKGIGVLYKRKKSMINLKPLVFGSQEQGLFAGTENVLGIASLGKAIETYDYEFHRCKFTEYVYMRLYGELLDSGVTISCLGAEAWDYRLHNNLFLLFPEIDTRTLVGLLDRLHDIQVSTGSACNNHISQPSNTLIAIGLNDDYFDNCLRITFSGNEIKEDVDKLIDAIVECVQIIKNK